MKLMILTGMVLGSIAFADYYPLELTRIEVFAKTDEGLSLFRCKVTDKEIIKEYQLTDKYRVGTSQAANHIGPIAQLAGNLSGMDRGKQISDSIPFTNYWIKKGNDQRLIRSKSINRTADDPTTARDDQLAAYLDVVCTK